MGEKLKGIYNMIFIVDTENNEVVKNWLITLAIKSGFDKGYCHPNNNKEGEPRRHNKNHRFFVFSFGNKDCYGTNKLNYDDKLVSIPSLIKEFIQLN